MACQRVEVGFVDRCGPQRAEHVLLQMQKAGLVLGRREVRDLARHQVRGRFTQRAGRGARAGEALDDAPWRVWSVPGDAGHLESGRIAPHLVAAQIPEHDRPALDCRIELVACGTDDRQDRGVPAASLDDREVRVAVREGLDRPLVELHAAVQAVEVHLVQVVQRAVRVGMAVDEARHHELARQVDLGGGGVYVRRDGGIDLLDPSVAGGVHRVDHAVGVDGVGRCYHGLCPGAGGPHADCQGGQRQSDEDEQVLATSHGPSP